MPVFYHLRIVRRGQNCNRQELENYLEAHHYLFKNVLLHGGTVVRRADEWMDFLK